MLETLNLEMFEGKVNQDFSLSYRNTPVATLELISVNQKPAAARSAEQRMPFSLIFRGRDNSDIADGCFTFEHPELGQLKDVFINRILPADPDDKAPHYQAVFN